MTDLLVIGAGPAGLAGATLAAELGLSVTLLDEQEAPGGQIYRAIERRSAAGGRVLSALGADYAEGAGLVAAFRRSGAAYLPGATVWHVGRDRRVAYSRDGRSTEIRGKQVLVATGAHERPVPMPGWTLPGVVTAGALQILLKSAGLVPDGRVVLAGSGPLLLLVAAQLAALGAPPAALVETMPLARLGVALGRLPKALRAPASLAKGLALYRAIRRAGIPVFRGATGLAVEGDRRAHGLVFTADGRRHRLEADIVALHQGVIPTPQIPRALDCAHAWSEAQRGFVPRVDPWLASSVEGVAIAGDAAGIAGAAAAVHRGRLAALGAATRLGRLGAAERDRRARPERAALAREMAIRPLLETLYAPLPETLGPADAVTVCRCEEVTAGRIRAAVRNGCPGPNQAKSLLRCGMGPCQGRLCGTTVSAIVAAERSESPDTTGYFRIRPPLKPIPLGELADLEDPPGADAA